MPNVPSHQIRCPSLPCVLVALPQVPSPLIARKSLYVIGDHRAAYARAGVLSKPRFVLESTTARICREVAVDGLRLFGGAHTAGSRRDRQVTGADGDARFAALWIDKFCVC